jgi:TrmH family RNA methyltransferase
MASELITSTANPRVKAADRLRDRRERDESGRTIVDGAREILRAIESGAEVEELWVSRDRCRSDDCRAALSAVSTDRRIEASEAVVDRLAFGDRSEGIVAVVRTPSTELARIDLPPDALVVVLEGVEKPGNVGAVLRSADAAGAAALLLADPGTDPFNPNAIRASLGTAFTIPIGVASADAVRSWLVERRLRVVAARVEAPTDHWDADLTGPLAVVVGSEARGLTGAWATPEVGSVTLPMLGVADSLNVSATAAVLLFEARRQRTVALKRSPGSGRSDG